MGLFSWVSNLFGGSNNDEPNNNENETNQVDQQPDLNESDLNDSSDQSSGRPGVRRTSGSKSSEQSDRAKNLEHEVNDTSLQYRFDKKHDQFVQSESKESTRLSERLENILAKYSSEAKVSTNEVTTKESQPVQNVTESGPTKVVIDAANISISEDKISSIESLLRTQNEILVDQNKILASAQRVQADQSATELELERRRLVNLKNEYSKETSANAKDEELDEDEVSGGKGGLLERYRDMKQETGIFKDKKLGFFGKALALFGLGGVYLHNLNKNRTRYANENGLREYNSNDESADVVQRVEEDASKHMVPGLFRRIGTGFTKLRNRISGRATEELVEDAGEVAGKQVGKTVAKEATEDAGKTVVKKGLFKRIGEKAGNKVKDFLAKQIQKKLTPRLTKAIGPKASKAIEEGLLKKLVPMVAKDAAKDATKTTVKRIPILGTAIGLIDAVYRASYERDPIGAMISALSGVATMIPFAGPWVSAAIDVFDIGRTIYLAEKAMEMSDKSAEMDKQAIDEGYYTPGDNGYIDQIKNKYNSEWNGREMPLQVQLEMQSEIQRAHELQRKRAELEAEIGKISKAEYEARKEQLDNAIREMKHHYKMSSKDIKIDKNLEKAYYDAAYKNLLNYGIDSKQYKDAAALYLKKTGKKFDPYPILEGGDEFDLYMRDVIIPELKKAGSGKAFEESDKGKEIINTVTNRFNFGRPNVKGSWCPKAGVPYLPNGKVQEDNTGWDARLKTLNSKYQLPTQTQAMQPGASVTVTPVRTQAPVTGNQQISPSGTSTTRRAGSTGQQTHSNIGNTVSLRAVSGKDASPTLSGTNLKWSQIPYKGTKHAATGGVGTQFITTGNIANVLLDEIGGKYGRTEGKPNGVYMNSADAVPQHGHGNYGYGNTYIYLKDLYKGKVSFKLPDGTIKTFDNITDADRYFVNYWNQNRTPGKDLLSDKKKIVLTDDSARAINSVMANSKAQKIVNGIDREILGAMDLRTLGGVTHMHYGGPARFDSLARFYNSHKSEAIADLNANGGQHSDRFVNEVMMNNPDAAFALSTVWNAGGATHHQDRRSWFLGYDRFNYTKNWDAQLASMDQSWNEQLASNPTQSKESYGDGTESVISPDVTKATTDDLANVVAESKKGLFYSNSSDSNGEGVSGPSSKKGKGYIALDNEAYKGKCTSGPETFYRDGMGLNLAGYWYDTGNYATAKGTRLAEKGFKRMWMGSGQSVKTKDQVFAQFPDLQPGDIMMQFGTNKKGDRGHAAMWNGEQWVSDTYQGNLAFVYPKDRLGSQSAQIWRYSPVSLPNLASIKPTGLTTNSPNWNASASITESTIKATPIAENTKPKSESNTTESGGTAETTTKPTQAVDNPKLPPIISQPVTNNVNITNNYITKNNALDAEIHN